MLNTEYYEFENELFENVEVEPKKGGILRRFFSVLGSIFIAIISVPVAIIGFCLNIIFLPISLHIGTFALTRI